MQCCTSLIHHNVTYKFKRSVSEWVKSLSRCPTLCSPMDCSSLPGSSVHGISQARVLEWVVISFSRGSSRPRDWTQVFCIVGRFFTIWPSREAQADRGMQLVQERGKESQRWEEEESLHFFGSSYHQASCQRPDKISWSDLMIVML